MWGWEWKIDEWLGVLSRMSGQVSVCFQQELRGTGEASDVCLETTQIELVSSEGLKFSRLYFHFRMLDNRDLVPLSQLPS